VEREGSRPDFAVLAYPVISLAHSSVHRGFRDHLLGENPTPSCSTRSPATGR